MYDLTHIMTDLVMCVRLYITYSLMQLMDSGFKTGSAARFLGGQQTSPLCATVLTHGSCQKVSLTPPKSCVPPKKGTVSVMKLYPYPMEL